MFVTFIKELLRRRVPQILGVYLAAGWGALEFTDFLVNHFILSSHLIDFVMLVWLLLVPTVVMLAYFHGAPGRDTWTRTEKIGIPVNVAVAGLLLIGIFAGKNLGAATESITLQDETGERVERVIPKSEFHQNLAAFYFDNVSGDTALDWLQYGMPLALENDLAQDIFLDVRGASTTGERLRDEGADELDVALPLKREIADRLHVNHFLAGEISGDADRLTVTTYLYETQRGKLVEERTFIGEDPLALADEMSVQLRRDIGIPAAAIEEGTDLPVSELLTASMPAFRSYVDAARANLLEDTRTALMHLEEAVSLDPQFAQAHFQLFGVYLNLNRPDQARAAAETGMRFIYKLPERDQFQLKTIYYWIVRHEADRALAAANMYAELYPKDAEAHSFLANFYRARGEYVRAVSALQRVLELDPSRVDVLPRIASLFETMGEFDAASDYYERYVAESPNDPGALIAVGNHYRMRGDYESAGTELEKALIIDPDNVTAMVSLAAVARDSGRFQEALQGLDEALAAAVTSQQRDQVYDAYKSYYELRGQPGRAIEYMHRRWAELDKYFGAFNTIQEKLSNLSTYVAAGRVDVAKDTLAAIAARLRPPNDVLLPLGQLNLYLALEEPDSLAMALDGFDRFIEAFGIEYARAIHVWAGGRLLEMRGECAEAIVSYERALQLLPTAFDYQLDIGRCYRKLGDFAQAQRHLSRLLEIRPDDPRTQYELALTFAEGDEQEKALEHLRIALDVWRDAEPEYQPAREARALYERLGPSR
ncbi:MAG: tetratricopeptide repeat protein [Gemmatimonadales bacterium]|jgi:tetratricopeptide (TPR) repeat protein